MNEIPPVPDAMRARLDHDSVRWQFGGSYLVAMLSVLALLGASIALGSLGPVGLLCAALLLVVSLMILAQSLQQTTILVTSRAITIERRALLGRHRQLVRIDEITHHAVAASDSGQSALVLRTRDETVVVGSGQDPAHLGWLERVVTHARTISSQREQHEGREWTFLRKPPPELTGVIERS